jgi:hypothetical protein
MPTSRYAQVVELLKADVPTRSLSNTAKLNFVTELKNELNAEIARQEANNEFVTAKPDYANLLPLVATEPDETVKSKIQEQAYRFTAPLSTTEEDLFNYVPREYVENNPGYDDANNWVSYLGSYPNPDTGEYS